MSDYLHQEKKKPEEIYVAPAQEDVFAREQEKSLEEQRRRFEEAKRARLAGKKAAAPAKAVLDEQQKEVILAEGNERVEENMPPKYAEREMAGQQAEKKQEIRTPLPGEMTEMLDEVLAWNRIKAETSAPVKNAADALKKAKTDAEAVAAMATLSQACTNYIEINGGNVFKSGRRKQVVRTLLEQIQGFGEVLAQKSAQQQGQADMPQALKWNGTEVKETVFKELKLVGTDEREQEEKDRIPAERFNEVYGEESKIPGFEDEAVLQMNAEELEGEAAQKLGLSRHLASEREKLILRRRSVRNIVEPRISKTRMTGTAEVFRTAEDKEALREWVLRENEKNKGKYEFRWSVIDYNDNSVNAYGGILKAVQAAPIDEFLDQDEGAFASSFAEKYEKLCKYASAGVILRIAEEKAEGTQISNSPGFSVSEIRAKIRFFTEMREQYEDRLRLMSSPFYVTQKAGDMAKYLGPDGEKEKEKVTDPKLLEYITLYQKVQGSRLAMGKGGEIKKYYESILDESRKEQLKRDEEKVKDAFEKIKDGEAAEKAYEKEHEPQKLTLSEDDARLEKSEKQMELFNQQKALNLARYPEDDAEFVKKIGAEVGGDLILGMNVNELNSMEKILVDDILLTGKVGGADIEPALLKEVKEMIHDFVHTRREFIAECYASAFVGDMADGMGLDLNNPLTKGSESLKGIMDYVTRDGVPEVIKYSVGLRRKDYSDKMTAVFSKLIGAGYAVFPKYQDRIEKEYEKTFSDDVKAEEPGMSSFTVNGREYKIVDELTQGLLKNAEGRSFDIQGEEGERLLQLLDEQQQLLERTYYVRKNYGDDGGQKFFISYSQRMYGLHQLKVMQRKIADMLGLVENPIPESMTEQLDEILEWEKVSAETSVPVKTAAQACKEAKTKGEIAQAMASLAFACTNYMEKNGDKLFKSSSRKSAVMNLLTSISDFYVQNDSGYYDVFAAGMENRTYKRATDFDAIIKNKLETAEGEKDIDVARAKKRQLEKDRESITENAYASGRRKFNMREVYRKNEDLYSDDYATVHGLSMPTEEERQKEFEALKEKTPQLTEEGYKIYERFKNAGNYIYHPEYRKIYERSKHNYKKTQGEEYTREALNLLRQVNFDKNYKPISEDDKKNHEFNLKVLRAFENDDLETREKLIAEELPRFLDDVELPTLITKEDILAWKNEKNAKKAAGMRSVLKARLDLWVDDFLKNGNAAAFEELHAKSFNINSLQKLHPGVKDYLKANTGLDAKFDTFDFLNNYIKGFARKNYKVSIGLSAKVEETADKSKDQLKRADKDMDNNMDALLDPLLERMLISYEHENDPEVSYKTDETVQREIDSRKEKIRTAREAEERKAREIAEHKKDMNESDSLLYDNIKLYQSRQTEAYRNALDIHTTIQKEKPSVKEKRKNAKLLSDNVNAVIDAKVKLRMDTPLAVKKKVDYRTFAELSDIAYLIGGQKELEKLVTVTAEGGYPALDYMTAQILKIDASSFDVSSDEAIAKNAVQLEKMTRGIEAYRKLVLKLGGEEYFKYLSEKKLSGVDGDAGQMALSQMDSLLGIAKYYRVRKLLMEDEGYIDRRRELTTGENPDDSFEMKRLKELQKTSDKYALTLKQSTWDVNRTAFNVLYGMDEKIYEERKEKAAKEGKQLPDRNAEEKTLNRLEHERYFVSPKWLQNAITITGDITTYQGDNPAYAATLSRTGDSYNNNQGYKNYGTRSYHEVLVEQQNKVQNKRFGDAPKFKGGKDAYLSEIEISDNWSRMHGQITTPLSYRRTPAELREMMDILCIQKRDEWDEIKKDPEAVAYYESAFKEMSMQFIEAIYANVKRVANSVGMQILVMHPADIAMQVTSRLKAELSGATVATNVDMVNNMPLVEKLFKENNADGRFLFDVQDFRDMGSVTANANWKVCNSGKFLETVVRGEIFEEDTGMTQKELEKMLFGKTGALKEGEKLKAQAVKELEDEIERQKKSGKVDPYIEDDLKALKSVEPGYFFLKAHPEVYNINTYCAKNPEGGYLFQNEFDLNGKNVFSAANAGGIRNVLTQGKLKKPKKSVLDKYEKSLKDRNMPAYMLKNDPYGIGLVKNNVESLIKKDRDGNPVLKDGKLQFKNI